MIFPTLTTFRSCSHFLLMAVVWMTLFTITGWADDAVPIQIQIDASKPQWTISPYLTGSHFVYAVEPDSLFADGRVAEWMRVCKVGVIRWPGGTSVQSYHWDHLNGVPFQSDSWAPHYTAPSPAIDPSNYMDLDKYLAFCRQVGAEPMIGVNIKSGKDNHREQDGLDEARRLVTYCKNQGYHVKFWYIGNEGYACDIGVDTYPAYIDSYGAMIKSLIPDAVIIADWKFGPLDKHRFEESVKIAKESKYLDMMEFHEKWGDDWGLTSGKAMNDWRRETSVFGGQLGDFTRRFHEEMAKAGKPTMKVSFNEWGLQATDKRDAVNNPFEAALIASDYLLEIFRNDVYQACYWNLNIGPEATQVLRTSHKDHTLLDFNPVAAIFKMYAHALGKTLLVLDSSDPHVYGFATIDPATKQTDIYLLNKAQTMASLQVSARNTGLGLVHPTMEAFTFPGTVKTISLDPIDPTLFYIDLQSSSFNRIILSENEPGE